jgi:hypothetical protein
MGRCATRQSAPYISGIDMNRSKEDVEHKEADNQEDEQRESY